MGRVTGGDRAALGLGLCWEPHREEIEPRRGKESDEEKGARQ